MDNPVFGSGRGTPVIRDAAAANMNNVTTTVRLLPCDGFGRGRQLLPDLELADPAAGNRLGQRNRHLDVQLRPCGWSLAGGAQTGQLMVSRR